MTTELILEKIAARVATLPTYVDGSISLGIPSIDGSRIISIARNGAELSISVQIGGNICWGPLQKVTHKPTLMDILDALSAQQEAEKRRIALLALQCKIEEYGAIVQKAPAYDSMQGQDFLTKVGFCTAALIGDTAQEIQANFNQLWWAYAIGVSHANHLMQP